MMDIQVANPIIEQMVANTILHGRKLIYKKIK